MSNVKGRGVRVEIAATYGTPITVTAVTLASPGVATSAAHGQSNDTVGYFSSVGREVRGVGEDHATARTQVQRGGECLEEVHRRRVAHGHVAGRRANQRRDAIADLHRQREPAGARPAADEAVSPFPLGNRRQPGGHVLRHQPERVAIEVDDAGRHVELCCERCQRIRRVERSGAAEEIAHVIISRMAQSVGDAACVNSSSTSK